MRQKKMWMFTAILLCGAMAVLSGGKKVYAM